MACDNRPAMLRPLTRAMLTAFLIIAVCLPLSSQAPADASADARLRSLYTEEWNWRQKELGRSGAASDRFASVDVASQQARLAYWTETLTILDTISLHHVLAPQNNNAQ